MRFYVPGSPRRRFKPPPTGCRSPGKYSTIAVPKAEELVATPYRHGTKQKAEKFFLDGMTQAMQNLAVQAHPAAPITIYYAFKQSETESKEAHRQPVGKPSWMPCYSPD